MRGIDFMTFKTKRLLFTLSPIIPLAVLVLLKPYLIKLSSLFPVCTFYDLTGYLCPACGNTRAVRSMLSLHFTDAVRYNATIPLLVLLVVLIYAETLIRLWLNPEKPVRLFPHKLWFYLTLLAVWFVYCFVRNIFNFMP
jgi:hypothetical protein